MSTHLFVVPSDAAFGEVVLGMRLAHELHGRGERVIFLAPASHAVLLRGTPFGHEPIDPHVTSLDRALPSLIAKLGADVVLICDLMVTLMAVGMFNLDLGFLDALPVPVVALDIWDLRRNDLRLDLHGLALTFPEAARTVVPRRLVPVPFANLDAPGGYCALPPPALSGVDRAAVRAELGVDEDDRLVVLTTSGFQSRLLSAAQLRAVAPVLGRLARLVQDAGERVRVLHVGPLPLDDAGPRYRHQDRVSAERFTRLLGAADLLVNSNQSATGISTALCLDVPALVAINSTLAADTFQFRVFPLGFYGFMTKLMAGNPYLDAITTVELFADDAVTSATRTLLFDEAARAATRARMASYLDEVRSLPSGAERLRDLLG